FSGFSTEDEPDTFAGFTFKKNQGETGGFPFLMKLDSDGNLIWGSNAAKSSSFSGQGIAFHETYIYLGLPTQSTFWGNLTIPGGPEGVGYVPDPVIIRFDAETGQSFDVFWVQGSDLS